MNSVTVGDHILDIYDFPLADGKFTFTADRDTFTLISSVSTHTRQGGKLIRGILSPLFICQPVSMSWDVLLLLLHCKWAPYI